MPRIAPLDPPKQIQTDVLIVGAGLAGLHCALRIKKEFPYRKIIIAEAYSYIGGRVHTYHPKPEKTPPPVHGLYWENGAGRIHATHRRVLQYVKRYNLTSFPITPTSEYRQMKFHPNSQSLVSTTEDPWTGISQMIYSLLSRLPKSVLAAYTIQELLEKTVGAERSAHLLTRFPYRAEIDTLRADAALHSLKTEMGTQAGYYVVKEGLSALIDGMVAELKRRPYSVEFALEHRLIRIESPDKAYFKTPTGIFTITSPRIIVAIPSASLAAIPSFRSWSLLQHLAMRPLLRIYAVFPPDPATGLAWFANIPKTVTNSPIRYFIPINPKTGVAMISYTDNQDTRFWIRQNKKSPETAEHSLLLHLRALFPECTIPDPVYVKFHEWHDGCTYWKPLDSVRAQQPTPHQLSRAAFRPFPRDYPNVFVCGESFSTRQAWMEGALEHADLLLDTHRQQILS